MKKKLHKGIIQVILTLLVISAIAFAVKAEFSINLTPLSGEPGDTIGVSSLTGDFEPLISVGIGFGEEVAVINEIATVTGSGMGPFAGSAANHPIKPGSFTWTFDAGSFTDLVIYDNGDGTLNSSTIVVFDVGEINYTSGFFSHETKSNVDPPTNNRISYVTYELDVTPDDSVTTASGYLIETVTVPSVPNGNYIITAIDEMGNVGVGTLQVIPEPLTVGAILLLSSVAVIVSFYWTRKRTLPKV